MYIRSRDNVLADDAAFFSDVCPVQIGDGAYDTTFPCLLSRIIPFSKHIELLLKAHLCVPINSNDSRLLDEYIEYQCVEFIIKSVFIIVFSGLRRHVNTYDSEVVLSAIPQSYKAASSRC
ncbi:hypothetical protein RB195_021902 [Necator americanus]|uniref:Uncharacterized protein n=1 Tax=Necator americanus TaxID=51031 RepID=A0ABR1ED72_NECAM